MDVWNTKNISQEKREHWMLWAVYLPTFVNHLILSHYALLVYLSLTHNSVTISLLKKLRTHSASMTTYALIFKFTFDNTRSI